MKLGQIAMISAAVSQKKQIEKEKKSGEKEKSNSTAPKSKEEDKDILPLAKLEAILSQIIFKGMITMLSIEALQRGQSNDQIQQQIQESIGAFLSETEVAIYKKYETTSEIVKKSTEKYSNEKTIKHLIIQLNNIFSSASEEEKETVEVPASATKEVVKEITEVIFNKGAEMQKAMNNQNISNMTEEQQTEYLEESLSKNFEIREEQLKKYNLTSLEYESALKLYPDIPEQLLAKVQSM